MEDGDDATTPLAMNPDTPTSTTSSSPTANNHDHKGNHARTSRSRSGSAASTTSNHRRNVSSSLLSKLSFLRVPNQNASPEQQGGYRNAAAVNEQGAGGHDDSANGGGNGGSGGDEGDGDGAEGDNDVPGSAPGTGVRGSKAMPSVLQQQQQQQQQLMMTRNQHATMNPLNASPPPMPTPSSPWTSSPHRTTPSASLGWDSLNVNSPPGMPSVSTHQSVSSTLPYASWANDAFLASSHAQLPPSSGLSGYQGFSSPPPGLSGRNRSSGQLGAIGETPPCGQGG